jgi:hypothetical protein
VNAVTGEISVSVEKDFLSTFYIPLPGYPISCQIDNVTMHCELMFKKTILVFGKYDLVFCYPDRVRELEPGYNAASLTRTFCEPIPLTGSDILEMLSVETIEIQPAFVLPLNARIRLGKPLNLKFWERFRSLFLRQTWVEVAIEARITAEIARNRCNTDLEIEESQSQFRESITEEQDEPAIPQQVAAVDLEELAGQVQKIISQRQEAKISLDLEAITALVQKIISRHEEEKASAVPPGQGEPEVMNMAKVTEVVLNILHARDAAKVRQEQQYRSQPPPAIERQGLLNVQHPSAAQSSQVPTRDPACGWNGRGCQPAPALLPDQIPSRPGFQAIIHNPPPKPPGYGG